MRALLIVDVQNDFLPGGALGVPRGDEVIAVANSLQAHFKRVVATKDWHPPDHGSFAANHPGHQPGDVVDLNGQSQILWPVHCVQNTPGSEFAPGLETGKFAKLFFKGVDSGVDSYSAFFDNAHLRATGLDEYLREIGVDELFIVGLATDYCVKFTTLDAVKLGLRTYVVEDGCRAVDLEPGDGARALREMRANGVKVVRSSRVPALVAAS